jgi:RNA-binding protein PNO1
MEVDSGVEGSSMSTQPSKVKRSKVSPDEFRKVPIPSHRYTPLRENWLKIFTPIVEHLHLQIRFGQLKSAMRTKF